MKIQLNNSDKSFTKSIINEYQFGQTNEILEKSVEKENKVANQITIIILNIMKTTVYSFRFVIYLGLAYKILMNDTNKMGLNYISGKFHFHN